MCSLQHSAVRHGKNAKKQFGRHPFHAVHSRWTGMTHELESSWPK